MATHQKITLPEEFTAHLAARRIHPKALLIDTKDDPPGYTYCYVEAAEAVARAQIVAEASGEPLVMAWWPPRPLRAWPGPGVA